MKNKFFVNRLIKKIGVFLGLTASIFMFAVIFNLNTNHKHNEVSASSFSSGTIVFSNEKYDFEFFNGENNETLDGGNTFSGNVKIDFGLTSNPAPEYYLNGVKLDYDANKQTLDDYLGSSSTRYWVIKVDRGDCRLYICSNHPTSGSGTCSTCSTEYTFEGYCGDSTENEGKNVSWAYDGTTKTITITGTGKMINYMTNSYQPWNSFIFGIEHIVIGNGVTSIGDYAFENARNVLDVSLSNSIKTIGYNALDQLVKVTSLTLPNELESISSYGLASMGLEEITLPNTITSIGEHAFDNCNNLKNIVLPNKLTSISQYLFGYCHNLKTVTIPETVTSIGYGAFYECQSLTSITIPKKVTSIGYNAFGTYENQEECNDLAYEAFTIKAHVKNDDTAFAYYNEPSDELENDTSTWKYYDFAYVSFDANGGTGSMDTITALSEKAVNNTRPTLTYNISNLACSFTAPSPDKEFAGWSYSADGDRITTESITLTDDVKLYALWRLKGNKITYNTNGGDAIDATYGTSLPNSLPTPTYTGHTFDGWYLDEEFKTKAVAGSPITADTTLYAKWVIKGYCGDKEVNDGKDVVWTYTPSSKTLVISGTGAMENFDYESPWYNYNEHISTVVIEKGVTTIGDNAFKDSYFTSITIPDGVTYIGKEAFYENDLESIVLPNSVQTIGKYAFYSNEDLENVTFGTGLKTIGDYAFSGDTSLTAIIVPDSVETIGEDAFYSCENVKTFSLGNGVKEIGEYAFCDCFDPTDGPTEIVIPDNVETIGGDAFSCNKSITSVKLGKKDTDISSYAFAETSITSITIGTEIYFNECTFGFDYDYAKHQYVEVDSFTIKAHKTTENAFEYYKDPVGNNLYSPVTWKYYDFAYVSFDANGGTGSMDTITALSEKAVNNTRPTLTYNISNLACSFTAPSNLYEFAGWSYSTDGAAITTESITLDDGDVKLYALWRLKGYTITYNTNGGTSVSQSLGTTLPNPLPTTSKDNHIFNGWFLDEGFNNKATAGASISQATTLYASFTEYGVLTDTTTNISSTYDGLNKVSLENIRNSILISGFNGTDTLATSLIKEEYMFTANGEFFEASLIPWNNIIAVDADSYKVFYRYTFDKYYTVMGSFTLTINKAKVNEPSITGTYTYNGSAQTVTLTGVEAFMSTTSSLTETNAGNYTLTYTLDSNHEWNENNDGILTWTISKNTYDMSNAAWNYTSAFIYDGEAKTVEVTGLPTGVTVTYQNNEKTNAGTYTASVTFTYDETNYNAPTLDNLSWTINKANAVITLSSNTVNPVVEGTQVSLPTATSTFGNVTVNKTASEMMTPGVYTVRYEVVGTDNYNGSYKEVTVTVKAKQVVKPDATTNSEVQINNQTEGIDPNKQVTVNVEVKVEAEITQTEVSGLTNDTVKLEKNEKISLVFDVKLYIDGQVKQPNDLGQGTTLTIKMRIPDSVDISKVTKILHVHSQDEIEVIDFDMNNYDQETRTYTLTGITKLSNFAFVYTVATTPVYVILIIVFSILLLIIIILVLLYFLYYKKKRLQNNNK